MVLGLMTMGLCDVRERAKISLFERLGSSFLIGSSWAQGHHNGQWKLGARRQDVIFGSSFRHHGSEILP